MILVVAQVVTCTVTRHSKRMVCEVAPDSTTGVVDLIYRESCAQGPRPAAYCKHYCCHIANVTSCLCLRRALCYIFVLMVGMMDRGACLL